MLQGDNRTIEVMNSVRGSLILCGHTHRQYKITHSKTSVLNPGSVGMPLSREGNTQFLILHGFDNKHMLLRMADVNVYAQKKAEYELIKQLSMQGIPMSTPIDFGTCDNGRSVYTLLSWIDGVEVETALPKLS